MPKRNRTAQSDKERGRALARLKEAVSSRSRTHEEHDAAKGAPRKAPVAVPRSTNDKPAR